MTQWTAATLFLALAALGACAEPNVDFEPRRAHPLSVQQEDVRLSLKAPLTGAAMSLEDEARMARFLRHFQERGQGSVKVEVLGSAGYEAGAWLDNARNILIGAGIQPDRIRLAADTGEGDGGSPIVRMSFLGTRVLVPECGRGNQNWGVNPNNLPVTNFGCATQRNVGLMIENPNDLVQARPVSERDPARAVNTIVDYRVGGVTTSSKGLEQQSGFGGTASEAAGRTASGTTTNSNTVIQSPVTTGGAAPTAAPAPTPVPTATTTTTTTPSR